MQKKTTNHNPGYTIIEVLIVLAITALLVIIVFTAVPALQRSSRNLERRQDAAAIAAGIDTYISDNHGQLPTGLANDTIHSNNLLIGIDKEFTDQPGLTNYESINLNYYNIDTADEKYQGDQYYAAGFGQQANILSDVDNIFIVALSPTATGTETPAVVSESVAPIEPANGGGDGNAGSVNANSVSIIPGEDCNTSGTGAGEINPGTVAIFFVIESGSGNGNLECIEGT